MANFGVLRLFLPWTLYINMFAFFCCFTKRRFILSRAVFPVLMFFQSYFNRIITYYTNNKGADPGEWWSFRRFSSKLFWSRLGKWWYIRPSIKNCVCCTPTYPLLTPLPKIFLALLENKTFFFAPFSSENHDFPIIEHNEGKKKKKWKTFFPLPIYPTTKYRVGVQQTNNFLRMTFSYSHAFVCFFYITNIFFLLLSLWLVTLLALFT